MSSNNFRIGLVFTPTALLSVGLLNGNEKDAYAFMERIQPLVDEFMGRVRDLAKEQPVRRGEYPREDA